MRYFISDVHGEYELFRALLEKIDFSDKDEMYICGDIIEKGSDSVKLARYVSSFSNIHCIIGNHEMSFLKYYRTVMENSPRDFDAVLRVLQMFFPEDEEKLDWDLVDWLDALPSYIEGEDFICVHAGLKIDTNGNILPLCSLSNEELTCDRRFKDEDIKHNDPKCVFFGHTPTYYVCGESKILIYKRSDVTKEIRDLYKIHLDTGAFKTGVLGCFCADTLEAIYVTK